MRGTTEDGDCNKYLQGLIRHTKEHSITRDCNDSLQRLGVDYVDVVMALAVVVKLPAG